jgi:DNA-binding response OmpR family regulator
MDAEAVCGAQEMLGKRRVLVVEDEALIAMALEERLREAGAEVVGPAFTAAEALRLVEAAAADGGISAAVLDLRLTGGETAIPVADALAARGVPFLFATGYGAGCDTGGHTAAPVLRKPYDPERLVASIEALAAAAR